MRLKFESPAFVAYTNRMGKLEHRECLVCGSAFTTYPSLNKRYCSHLCKGIARRKPDSEYAARVRNACVPLGHPLVMPGRKQVQLHRLLLWQAIGPGAHPCYHCGELVTWTPGSYTAKGSLVVDHLDRNPLNNDLSNLKPSCQTCNKLNSARTVSPDEVHRIDSDGKRKRGDLRSCIGCGAPFVTWSRAEGKGRYCSKSCAGDAGRASRWGKRDVAS